MAKKPPLTVRSISKGLKSASQMIAESSRSVIEEVMPNMSTTWFSLQAEATNTVNKALSNTSSVMNRQHSLVSRTKLGRNIQTSVNKMAQRIGLSDYEGNQMAFELENFTEDFDSDTFTESADGKDSFENGYGTTENMKALSAMNRNLTASGLATVKSMNNMTHTLASVNMESTKAISSTIENMSIAQTNAISSGMSEVVRQIQITNNYTAAMLDFMNKNLSPNGANMADTMSIIGAKLDEISEAIKSNNRSIAREDVRQESAMDKVFSDGSGFDIGSYKKAMKEAFNETGIGSTISMLTTTLDSFSQSVKSGGAKGAAMQFGPMLTKAFAKGFTTTAFGVNTKDALARADGDLSRAMKNILWKLGDMAEDPNSNKFQQMMGSIFGVKRSKLKGLDMSQGRKDEVIGWNGVAQTALTQVIPNYLASIEKSLSRSKEQKFYDYETGVFKTESKLMEDMVGKLIELNRESFADTTSRIVDALAKEGASSKDVTELIGKLDTIINRRINEGRGKDKEFDTAMADAFKPFNIDSAMQGRIGSMFEESIEEMTKGLTRMYERISNESTEYLAARNIFNNFDQTRQKMAERFMKANKSFINPSLFNSMTSYENGYNPGLADKFGEKVFTAVNKEGQFDDFMGGTFELGQIFSKFVTGASNAAYASTIDKSARRESMQRGAEKRAQFQEAKVEGASSKADDFDSSEPPLPKGYSSPGKMTDSKVKTSNVKIGEAISSGNPNSILQGLVMSLHNNLLAPMYTDFFSENGMLHKFFGDDPNSEFNQLKEKLFGKENGLLTPLVDWTKYQFTGKGYTARSGKVYEDKKGINAYAKELYGDGFGYSMNYLFGEDYAQNETYQKFFHFLSPEGIKETKDKIKAFKEHAKLEAQYIATFRDLKDKVLADEVSSKDYTKQLGNIMTAPNGKTHATGLFKDLIENLDQDASARVLEKIDRYNKELVEVGKLDSKKYGKLGEGRKRLLGYSQHNPKWADIVTGLRGDGSIATMDNSGCGIMALVYAANAMGKDITVDEALRFAKTNGGLTEGGANKYLYTNSRNGLGGREVTVSTAMTALERNIPAVVAGSGKGYGSSNPFGIGDHIMTLLRKDGDTITGIDPETGIAKPYHRNELQGIHDSFIFNKPALGRAWFGKKKKTQVSAEPPKANYITDDLNKLLIAEKASEIVGDVIWLSSDSKVDAIKKILTDNHFNYDSSDSSRITVTGKAPVKPEPKVLSEEEKYRDEIKSKIGLISDAIRFRKDGDGFFSDFYQVFNEVFTKPNISGEVKATRENTGSIMTYLKSIHMNFFGKDIKENEKVTGGKALSVGNTIIISNQNNAHPIIVQQTSSTNTTPDSSDIKPTQLSDLQFQSSNITIANATINLPSGQLDTLLKVINNEPITGNAATQYRMNEEGNFEPIVEEESEENENLLKDAYEAKVEEQAKQMETFENAVKDLNERFEATSKEAVDEPKDFRDRFLKDLKKYNTKFKKAPGAFVKGGLIGGAIGLMNMSGAGLLTSLLLPTSPVGGAIAGLGLTMLSRSEKFNNMLFGEKDENGARKGGLISKSQVASFKKALPYAVGGATVGIVKNLLTGALGIGAGVPGIFGTALLGTNPIGAAIVGLGLGVLKNNEKFNKMLFGDKNPDGKHSGGLFSKGLDKAKAIVDEISGYGKGALKGAGIGLGAGIVASNMGYLPAALSIGGPIGAAIAGLGIGIASNSDRFKRFLFGDEYIDDEGKSTRKKNGLVHRTMNKIMDEVVYPLKNTFQDSVEEFVMWGKKNIVLPFKLAFGPLIDSFATFKDDLKNVIHDAFENLVDGITGILRGGLEKILTPFNTAIRKVGQFAIKGVTKGAELAALLPSAGLKLMAYGTHKKRKRDDKEYRNAMYDNLEDKWARDEEASDGTIFGSAGLVKRKWTHFKDLLGVGEFANPEDELAAREAYGEGMTENGRNALGWISARAKYNRDRAKFKADKKLKANFRQAEGLMTKWKKQDDHIEDRGWTDELIEERSKELRKLGLLKEGVSTEEDIKQLMYHRGDWQKRFGEYGTENLAKVAEAEAVKEAQEKTEEYQDGVTSRMDKILDYLSGKGRENTANQNAERSEKKYGNLKNKYWYNKYEITEEDIERIEKYTQGHVDFSESTVRKFTEYAKNMRERGNTNYYMDKDTYDDVFKDEVASGAMQSYEEYMEDVARKKAEKERLDAIDNGGFIVNLFSRGYITKPIFDTMMRDYSNADMSRRELIEKAAELTFNGVEQYTNMGYDKDGKFAGYYQDAYKDAKTGDIDVKTAVDQIYKDDQNFDLLSDRMYDLMETNQTVNSAEWMDWLSEVISTSMLDAEEEIAKQEEEERLEAEEKAREAAEQEKATEGTNRSTNADDNRKWFEKFFVGKDGELNLLGKAGNKLKNSWIGKLIKGVGSLGSVISNSPMLQLGLLAGAFAFKDQIGDVAIKIADGVKTVFKEWVPTAWNFVTETAIPFIWSNISTVAEYAIKAIPEILSGIKNGLSFLWNDMREWMGLKWGTDKYSADEVDTATGMTSDGQRVAQYIDENGNVQYILTDKGEYQVLGDYQYISDDGTIENISRGTGGNLGRYAFNAIRNPNNLAGGMKMVGGAVSLPSKILKKIPVLGNAFRVTEAGGDMLVKGGKNLGKYIKENTVDGKSKSMIGFIQDALSNKMDKANMVRKDSLNKKALSKASGIFSKSAYSDTMTTIFKNVDELGIMENNKALNLFDTVIKYGADSKEVQDIFTVHYKGKGKKGKNQAKKLARKLNKQRADENIQAIIDYGSTIRDSALKYSSDNIDDVAKAASEALQRNIADATAAAAKQGAIKAAKEGVSNAVGKEAKNIAKKALKEAGGGAWNTAKGKAGKFIKKMIDGIKKGAGGLRKLIDGTALDKLLKKLTTMGDNFLSMASESKLGQFVSEVASKAFKMADDIIPFVNIAFMAYDAIKGWCNTENLFGVPEGHADGLMKTISAVMNFILGLGIGPIFDIFLTIYSSITGTNVKQEFAVWLYDTLCTIAGDTEAMQDLRNSQAILEKELERYNADHVGGELTLQEYLALKEEEDSLGNQFKKVFGIKGAIDTSKYESANNSEYKDSSGSFKSGSGNNFLERLAEEESAQAELLAQSAESLAIATENLNGATGYGKAVGYGNAYSQADPKWAKFTLGKFPNGQTATMDLAGCGPTALANVASQMNKNISPVEVANMAVKNGYITDGGANARLFEEGATRLGLSSRRIGTSDITRHLANGEKIIVSGKSRSAGYGNIFTEAGHIVTIEGKKGNSVLVTDPQTGITTTESLSKMNSQLTNAWAFSNSISSNVNSYSIPRRTYNVGYGTLGSGVYTFTNNPTESYSSKEDYEYADKFSEIISNYVNTSSDKAMAYDMLRAINYDGMTSLTYASDADIAKEYERFRSIFSEMNETDYAYITQSPEVYNRFMTYAYHVFGLGSSLYDFYKLSKGEMFRSMMDLTSSTTYAPIYNELKTWWDNYSNKDQKLYYWVTDKSSHPNAMTSHSFTSDPTFKKIYDNKSYADKPLVHYIMEIIMSEYAMSHPDEKYRLSATDVEKINKRHGFYNMLPSQGIVYEDESKLDEESLEIMTEYVTPLVSEGLAQVKKNPNLLENYNGLTGAAIYKMSDPAYGGDSSLMNSWLYRLLYNFLSSGNKSDNELTDYMLLLHSFIKSNQLDRNDYKTLEGRPYGIINGIPYYSINHEEWATKKWRGMAFSQSGHDIASLASILTAYNLYNGDGIAITPNHMLTNWFVPANGAWYNSYGIKENFFSKIGLQSLREVFDENNKPLKITQTTSGQEILDAMKLRKLVLIANNGSSGKEADQIFGNSNFAVGSYADDNFFLTFDPTYPNQTSYPVNLVSEFPTSGGMKGYIFETSEGNGLKTSANHELDTPSLGSSKWSEINQDTNDGLGLLSKIFRAISAMTSNVISGFVSNLDGGEWEYESIFTEKMDENNSGKAAENEIANLTYLNDPVSDGKVVSGYGYGYIAPRYSRYNIGYGIGGENDAVEETEEVTYDLSTIEGVFGRVSQILGQRTSEAMNGKEFGELVGTNVTGSKNNKDSQSPYAMTDVDPNTIQYGDRKSAHGLVIFAKSMKNAGCRYVWGGSCKKFDKSYYESLRRDFGNDKAMDGDRTYYEDKFAKYANCYVSDCSGLIRGYTNKGSLTANSLYTSSQFKGKISTMTTLELTTPGILVFRKGKETSNMVHVGIVVGDGKNVIHIAGEEANALSDVRLEPITSSNWTHWGKNTSVLDYSPIIKAKNIETLKPVDTGSNMLSRSDKFSPVALVKGGENDIFGRNMTVEEYAKSLGYGPGKEVKYLLNTLGGRITQRVGLGIDPTTGTMTRHRGTDIAALYNSPIHSPVSGTVVENRSASYGSDYGNYVVVRDNSGKKHLIAHMNEASGYGVGSRINTGDIIGRVGSSGRSTGPHVHYEVRERNHVIDPLSYGKDTMNSLGLKNKTHLNILERKLDEAMTKHGSPVGGTDDILANLNTALSGDNSELIVDTLREIVSILSGWSSMDAESKDRILTAMEDASNGNNTVNVNNNNTTLNNATSNNNSSTNLSSSNGTTHSRKIESTGGRSLHDLIARKGH